MKSFLITGGAGFVGSRLALYFKQDFPDYRIVVLDNLHRRGSEVNLIELQQAGIKFVHGDIRNPEDLANVPPFDCLIECSAQPSALAGYGESPEFLIQTNLVGTINCLEAARRQDAAFVFLSTSRVYPISTLNEASFIEAETRFELTHEQIISGMSERGVSESFPLDRPRSMYGATKLAGELLLMEYADMYGMPAIINRSGVLSGRGQMGRVDQGVVGLWAAHHIYQKPLSYHGFGGTGKQVRDILHVHDLYRLLLIQLEQIEENSGQIYNVGGGREYSISLLELTNLCQQATGQTLELGCVPETHPADIRIYLTDTTRVKEKFGWHPEYTPTTIVEDIVSWIHDNRDALAPVLG